jgi:hypothetical protein
VTRRNQTLIACAIAVTAIAASVITRAYDARENAKQQASELAASFERETAYLKWDACLRGYIDHHAMEFPALTSGELNIDEAALRAEREERYKEADEALARIAGQAPRPSSVEIACGQMPPQPFNYPYAP